jgi:hypothetical protein
MDSSQGLLKLSILNAETQCSSFSDASVYLLNRGAPAELVTRLDDLWCAVQVVGGEIVHVGRIIVGKIVEFVRAHRSMVIGIAVGAAAGALLHMVPLIGPLVAPVAMAAGAVIGAFTGAQMDNANPNASLFETAIVVAKAFFELLAEIFQAVAAYWTARN